MTLAFHSMMYAYVLSARHSFQDCVDCTMATDASVMRVTECIRGLLRLRKGRYFVGRITISAQRLFFTGSTISVP
jgi:hypothetical protein